MKVEPPGESSSDPGPVELTSADRPPPPPQPPPLQPPPLQRRRKAAKWLSETNGSAGLIGFIRSARRRLPGDPHFGDRLSASGFGGPQAAARAAERLLGDRDAASRELSLAALQVWQALSERVARRPALDEVTLVFTDLVGFSRWALQAGDDATLKLLRIVAQTIEPPLLQAGGQVVKRMGDGIMAVFPDTAPGAAVAAVLVAQRALQDVEVAGHTPVMRVGIHTGRPQRIGSDWLGVDVNIAARVMENATKGGVLVSGSTLEHLALDELDALGVVAKRVRKPVFSHRLSGVPPDVTMYRLDVRRDVPAVNTEDEQRSQA